MEQARYWMWAKSAKPDPNRCTLTVPAVGMAPYGDSWEEQAFAEDAAGGALGGSCVWPPRSYSCSFCRREFKSAQALGGHMNVHRRDRARLKQQPNSSTSPTNHLLLVPPQPQVCTSTFDATTFLFDNPNPSSHPPPSWSSFLSEKRDRGVETTHKKRSAIDPESRADNCVTEVDVSKSLSLVVVNDQTQTSDEEVASCKRRKIEAKPSIGATVEEELDLELRLGNAPGQGEVKRTTIDK